MSIFQMQKYKKGFTLRLSLIIMFRMPGTGLALWGGYF